MSEQTLWSTLIMAVVIGEGGWMVWRYGSNQNFPLNRWDWAIGAAFAVLLVGYTNGWHPVAGGVVAVLTAALGLLAWVGYRWAIKSP